jgi:predicted HAD superfamily Cof-like phosphohydrolase
MTKVFRDVQVFMAAAGQTISQENISQSSLYHNLIVEEYAEYIAARNKSDDVETIDACFDMIWVIVGYMLSRGWDLDRIWDEGSLSNLKKIDKSTGYVTKREDGKIMKPEGWKPPDFSKFVKGNDVT